MTDANPEIRRTLLHVQTTHIEGGRAVAEPTKLVAALAIIRNPWAGMGFVENLRPEIQACGPVIGKLLTDMILEVTGDALEGYGKASVVGMGGELEHAQALTHTLWFGNQYREAVGAKTYLAFSNLRSARRSVATRTTASVTATRILQKWGTTPTTRRACERLASNARRHCLV